MVPEDAEPERLPDQAVVIRGGVMTHRNVASRFETSFRTDGVYDISVEASAYLDAVGIARWVRERDPGCERMPHSKFQESTAGAIRAAGAEVLLTEPPEGHHSIRFSAAPTDDEITALMGAFGQPQDNPVARPKEA